MAKKTDNRIEKTKTADGLHLYRLTESAADLFAPMQSFPEIVCINSYQEEGLDYKWQNKYRTSIEEWSQYGG